eukprot:2764015-Prymnesium_polylepis.1
MCLALWLDAERGGQLVEEQPASRRPARRRGERAQRCSGGAVAPWQPAGQTADAAAAIALSLRLRCAVDCFSARGRCEDLTWSSPRWP